MKEIITKAKDGDKHAMNQLYSLYAKSMLNTSYRIVNSIEDAEDILQESFIKAFSSLHQFQFRSTFGAWIKRIVINKSIDHLRKKKREPIISINKNYTDNKIDNSINNENERSLLVEQVNKAIQQLPTGYRTVLSLYLIEGYDHEEISQILSIKYATSLSQFSRAKKKLVSIIDKNNIVL